MRNSTANPIFRSREKGATFSRKSLSKSFGSLGIARVYESFLTMLLRWVFFLQCVLLGSILTFTPAHAQMRNGGLERCVTFRDLGIDPARHQITTIRSRAVETRLFQQAGLSQAGRALAAYSQDFTRVTVFLEVNKCIRWTQTMPFQTLLEIAGQP